MRLYVKTHISYSNPEPGSHAGFLQDTTPLEVLKDQARMEELVRDLVTYERMDLVDRVFPVRISVMGASKEDLPQWLQDCNCRWDSRPEHFVWPS